MSSNNCIEEVLLSAYLDGELGEEDAMRAEMHLAACPHCSDVYESMKADRNLLVKSFPDAAPAASLRSQLFSRINSQSEVHRALGIPVWAGIGQILSLRHKAWAFACVSVVLLAVIIVSAFNLQRRIADKRMLAEIDRSRAEWVARDKAANNPFDIAINSSPLRPTAKNPFEAYLNAR